MIKGMTNGEKNLIAILALIFIVGGSFWVVSRKQLSETIPAGDQLGAAGALSGPADKSDYLEYIKSIYQGAGQHNYIYGTSWSSTTESYQPRYATWEAFFSRILGSGEKYLNLTSADYARKSVSLLRGANIYLNVIDPKTKAPRPTYFASLLYPMRAYTWIKDNPGFTAEGFRNKLFMLSYLGRIDELYQGPALLTDGGQSMDKATGIQLLAKAYPTSPKAPAWKAYADTLWNSWWQERDRTYNSSHYDTLWLQDLILWLDGSQALDPTFSADTYYRDPGVKNFAERYLQYLSPTGAVPNYGDSLGISTVPGKLILFFEKMATKTGDGRYKWAAHRIFEWVMTHQNDMLVYGDSRLNLMEELMEAYLYADDGIAEVTPTMRSSLLTRKKFIIDWPTQSGFSLTNTVIPDKLILRSGWTPNDLYGMLELTPNGGHGHSDVASLNFLSANNSVLLADTPYLVRDHRFHNAFQVVTNPKGPWGEVNGSNRISMAEVTVPLFKDDTKATVAQVKVKDYQATGADLDREIFFVKNNFIWIRDKVTSNKALTAKIGPAWQTVGLTGQSGSNWVDTSMPELPVPYIWELRNMMKWQNSSHNLLVTFPTLSGSPTIATDSVIQDDTRVMVPSGPVQNTMKYRIWSKRDKTITPDTPEIFQSVLIPHSPTVAASSLAGAVSVIYEANDATIIKVALPGQTGLLLGLNNTGATLTIPAGNGYPTFITDAKSFYFELGTNGAVNKYWITEATKLTVSGQALLTAPSRIDDNRVVPSALTILLIEQVRRCQNSTTPTCIASSDLNHDGKVNAFDLIKARGETTSSSETLSLLEQVRRCQNSNTSICLASSDLNSDGKVNTFDLIKARAMME